MGYLSGHPLDPNRRGMLSKMTIVRIAEPLVRCHVARHAAEAGESCKLVEHGAQLLTERTTPPAIGGQATGGKAMPDRLDERGGHIRVVGFVAVDHPVATVTVGHDDTRNMVSEINETDDFAELDRRPREEESAAEKVTRALDSFAGAEEPFVSIRSGDDRANEERAVDAPPRESNGVVHEAPAMRP